MATQGDEEMNANEGEKTLITTNLNHGNYQSDHTASGLLLNASLDDDDDDDDDVTSGLRPASSWGILIARNLQKIIGETNKVQSPVAHLQTLEDPSRTQDQENAALEGLDRFRSEAANTMVVNARVKKLLHGILDIIDQQWPRTAAVDQSASQPAEGGKITEANPSQSNADDVAGSRCA